MNDLPQTLVLSPYVQTFEHWYDVGPTIVGVDADRGDILEAHPPKICVTEKEGRTDVPRFCTCGRIRLEWRD